MGTVGRRHFAAAAAANPVTRVNYTHSTLRATLHRSDVTAVQCCDVTTVHCSVVTSLRSRDVTALQ